VYSEKDTTTRVQFTKKVDLYFGRRKESKRKAARATHKNQGKQLTSNEAEELQ
jgi:hypothetical protein